jgi:hypothetical protein
VRRAHAAEPGRSAERGWSAERGRSAERGAVGGAGRSAGLGGRRGWVLGAEEGALGWFLYFARGLCTNLAGGEYWILIEAAYCVIGSFALTHGGTAGTVGL